MNVDPKQIARMITEDPDEVAPNDHFDDFEDEYTDAPYGYDEQGDALTRAGRPWTPELFAPNRLIFNGDMIVDYNDDPNLFTQIRQKMDAGAPQGSSWFDPIPNRAEAEAYEVLTAKEFYDYLLGKRGDPRSGEKGVWQGFETDTLIQNGLPEDKVRNEQLKIDPKKIARMITEDPDVAPSDHFDDFEDEYEDEDAGPICDTCGIRYNQNSPNHQYPGLIYSEVVRLSEILCASGYPCSRPFFNGRAFGDPVLPNMPSDADDLPDLGFGNVNDGMGGPAILPYCACGSGKVYKKCCRDQWKFCSSDCAREQRDKLKIEIEHNS